MSTPSAPSRTRIAHLRALALLGVVLVHGVEVAPLPHKVHPSELKDPVAREEVRRWTERLEALGYTISPEELGQRVVKITDGISSVQRGLTSPFRPWFRWTGTDQGWALFANPDTHPSRLEVVGKRPDGEVVLFRSGDPEHAELLPWLKHRRLRPVFDAASVRRRPNKAYRRLVDWIWRQSHERHPELESIEVRLLQTNPVLPGSNRREKPAKARHTVRAPR